MRDEFINQGSHHRNNSYTVSHRSALSHCFTFSLNSTHCRASSPRCVFMCILRHGCFLSSWMSVDRFYEKVKRALARTTCVKAYYHTHATCFSWSNTQRHCDVSVWYMIDLGFGETCVVLLTCTTDSMISCATQAKFMLHCTVMSPHRTAQSIWCARDVMVNLSKNSGATAHSHVTRRESKSCKQLFPPNGQRMSAWLHQQLNLVFPRKNTAFALFCWKYVVSSFSQTWRESRIYPRKVTKLLLKKILSLACVFSTFWVPG